MRDAAVIVMLLTGLIHSIAGEIFIWRKAWSIPGWPVFLGNDYQSKVIVRVTWHLATIFAFAFAAILHHTTDAFVVRAIAVTCGASALLVLVGTKARHGGWLAFTALAILCWLSA